MYGASLTKAVFAYTVMQLVEEGKLGLDTSIAAYLPKPLPEYTGEEKSTRPGSISAATSAGANSRRASC